MKLLFQKTKCHFSPHGHYFVSGGHDRVARLWTREHYQPVRMFAGHFSDVDVSTRLSRFYGNKGQGWKSPLVQPFMTRGSNRTSKV